MAALRHAARAGSPRRLRRGQSPEAPSRECRRCGSAQVVPARAHDRTEHVLELRIAGAPSAAQDDSFPEWLCTMCGYRWPHLRPLAGTPPSPAPSDEAAQDLPGDAVEALELPDGSESAHLGPRRVADALRRAREARGLTTSDAAKETCIWERYLRLLEDDATLEHFPAPVYARSFLKAYAEFLGLDPEELVREFDRDHPVDEEPVLAPFPNPRPRHRVLAAVLIVASVASLTAIAFLRARDDRTVMPFGPPEASEQPGTVVAPDGGSERPKVVRGVRAVLAVTGRSWIEAVGDGEVLESGVTLEPGARVVFRADRVLELVLGNAGGVQLEANGDRVETGSSGEVVRLELRWRDGELVTRFA